MTAAKTQPPMCVLTVGFTMIAMPVAKALKVVELLSGAAEVDREWLAEEPRYRVRGDLRTEFRSVRQKQFIFTEEARTGSDRPGQKLLGKS